LSDYRILGDTRFADARVVSTWSERYAPLRITVPGVEIPADAVWDLEQVSPTAVRLSWEGGGVRVTRKLEAGSGPYQIWSTVRVENLAAAPKRLRLEVATSHFVRAEDESGGFFAARSPAISQGTCVYDDETVRKDGDDLQEAPHGYAGQVHFSAIESVYFVNALASHGAVQARRCALNASAAVDRRTDTPHDGTVFEARLVYPATTLDPGASQVWQSLAYLGPKEPNALNLAGHRLPEVVDLGFFALIARQLARLLGLIHQYVGSWGLAIILLTLLVRLVLSPLTARSFQSAARMRKLKPELDRINEMYSEDREKKSAAMMELYRKHKINPFGGCLPQLLQLPIWWALYTSLSTNMELYHVPFALWPDLSAKDPYYALPIVLGVLMHVQQRLTPTSMDPAQAKMMMWMMPIMITVFMLFLPSGLCIYMLTNSALGIAQQKLIEWQINRKNPPAAEVEPAGSDATDDGDSSEEGELAARKRVRRPRRVRRGRA
ncbi:MAG: membrane protein insertase YidC, partial [Sandaracinaceae bacterium]|nr:membrane protein insertase YidC [Sandaracinaceae bacterium]